MTTKYKQTVLSIEDKIAICECLDKGCSKREIACECKICFMYICLIIIQTFWLSEQVLVPRGSDNWGSTVLPFLIEYSTVQTNYNLNSTHLLRTCSEKVAPTYLLHISKCVCITQEHRNLLLVCTQWSPGVFSAAIIDTIITLHIVMCILHHCFISTGKVLISDSHCSFLTVIMSEYSRKSPTKLYEACYCHDYGN